MDHTVSSHRTSADDDSLFLAATFSTSQHRNTSCKLLVTEHPLHSSPNMRLQCHDSLTLFHVSQPPSYRCPAIQTHHPYVSLPAVIAVCHHSMSSSLQLVNAPYLRHHRCKSSTHNYVVTTSATSLHHHQLSMDLHQRSIAISHMLVFSSQTVGPSP